MATLDAAASSEAAHFTVPQPQPSAHPQTRRPIKPRTFDLKLDAEVPRQWMAGNTIGTALINSVGMLFPAGERFFVRSVHHYLPDLPAELRESVQGFFAQEGRHAQAHERVNHLLTEQGYSIATFLRLFETIAFGLVERAATPELRLASTAACEHFTAILADNFLRNLLFMENVNQTMYALLTWHAAEEIEHKAVAFDVLKHVDPRYRTRIAGLLISSLLLAMFWFGGVCVLLAQDGWTLGLRRLLADARQIGRWRAQRQRRGILAEVFGRGIREYLRRDFHPSDLDNYELAQAHLKQ